jgi:threonine dehydrogenase-like Zn-dependent dehydrogenase
MELTDGLGADVAFEAVGVPQTFELATELIRPGGRLANIGVHGKPARCTWRSCGSATSRSRPGWSTRSASRS